MLLRQSRSSAMGQLRTASASVECRVMSEEVRAKEISRDDAFAYFAFMILCTCVVATGFVGMLVALGYWGYANRFLENLSLVVGVLCIGNIMFPVFRVMDKANRRSRFVGLGKRSSALLGKGIAYGWPVFLLVVFGLVQIHMDGLAHVLHIYGCALLGVIGVVFHAVNWRVRK